MLTVKVNAYGLIRSLTRLGEEFKRTTENAVYETSAELVNNIINDTLVYPPKKGNVPTVYKRTHRLVNGWGEAARTLGLSLMGSEESESTDSWANLNFNENTSSFRAENRVPYALDVENDPGPWDSPYGPFADPPNFRGGYYIVRDNKEKTGMKFPNSIREAWKLAKDAS